VKALGAMAVVIGATFLVASAGAAAAVLIAPLPERVQIGAAIIGPSTVLTVLSLVWAAVGSAVTAAAIRIRQTGRRTGHARVPHGSQAPQLAPPHRTAGAGTARSHPLPIRYG
jgi:hypothetical protein